MSLPEAWAPCDTSNVGVSLWVDTMPLSDVVPSALARIDSDEVTGFGTETARNRQ